MSYSWTNEEVDKLLVMRTFGSTIRAIAGALGRPEASVYSQWKRLKREGKTGAPLPEDDADRAALKAQFSPQVIACQAHLRDLVAVGGRYIAVSGARRVQESNPPKPGDSLWHAERKPHRS